MNKKPLPRASRPRHRDLGKLNFPVVLGEVTSTLTELLSEATPSPPRGTNTEAQRTIFNRTSHRIEMTSVTHGVVYF